MIFIGMSVASKLPDWSRGGLNQAPLGSNDMDLYGICLMGSLDLRPPSAPFPTTTTTTTTTANTHIRLSIHIEIGHRMGPDVMSHGLIISTCCLLLITKSPRILWYLVNPGLGFPSILVLIWDKVHAYENGQS